MAVKKTGVKIEDVIFSALYYALAALSIFYLIHLVFFQADNVETKGHVRVIWPEFIDNSGTYEKVQYFYLGHMDYIFEEPPGAIRSPSYKDEETKKAFLSDIPTDPIDDLPWYYSILGVVTHVGYLLFALFLIVLYWVVREDRKLEKDKEKQKSSRIIAVLNKLAHFFITLAVAVSYLVYAFNGTTIAFDNASENSYRIALADEEPFVLKAKTRMKRQILPGGLLLPKIGQKTVPIKISQVGMDNLDHVQEEGFLLIDSLKTFYYNVNSKNSYRVVNAVYQ